VLANTYILTESLYTFWLVFTIFILMKAADKDRAVLWVIGAILLAITSLIRPTTQYFIIFLAFLIWFYAPTDRRTRILVATISAYVFIMAIWAIRNLYAIGSTSDPQLIINGLHHGMYPHFVYNDDPSTFGFPYRYDPDSPRISDSVSSTLQAILQRFINQPLDHLFWYLSKPAYLFQWNHIQGINIFTYPPLSSTYFAENSIFDITRKMMQYIHYPLVILSMTAAIVVFTPLGYSVFRPQQRRSIQLIAALYLYFIAVHIITAPFPRYSIPIRPLTYILALTALFIITTKLSPRIQNSERST
jgi:hypothetical protein